MTTPARFVLAMELDAHMPGATWPTRCYVADNLLRRLELEGWALTPGGPQPPDPCIPAEDGVTCLNELTAHRRRAHGGRSVPGQSGPAS